MKDKVKLEMTSKVFCVLEGDKLSGVWSKMQDMRINHVPVVRGRILVGMLSDRDVLLHSNFEDNKVVVPPVTVASVMTKDVVTCTEESRVGDATDLMIEKNIHALPVVKEGNELVGILTTRDLLADLRRQEGVIDVQANKLYNFELESL